MARKKKRKKPSRRLPKRPSPKGLALRLAKPEPLGPQMVRFGVAFACLFAAIALALATFVFESLYFIRAMFDGSIEKLPLPLHIVWSMVDLILVLVFLKSPFFRQPELRGIPIELIDFSYVMRFQRRQYYFVAGLISLNVIPILYLNGTLDMLSDAAIRFGSNSHVAKPLGWLATVALSGVIGNFTTYVVMRGARFMGSKFARRKMST